MRAFSFRYCVLLLFIYCVPFAGVQCLAEPGNPTEIQSILVFGDSLSAGYGIAVENAWPALLQKRLNLRKSITVPPASGHPQPARIAKKATLQKAYRNYNVINASISGETTAGGYTRFARTLQQTQPSIVILELGANDGLRGLPLQQAEQNLSRMLQQAKAAKARVLLVGVSMPPNLDAYAEDFARMYARVAKRANVPLVASLLAKVVGSRDNFQSDNLHPTAAAQPLLEETIWERLEPLLD